MKKFLLLLPLFLGYPASPWASQSLKESTFTQVIKDVKIVSRASQSAITAKVSDRFEAPDLIRTGPDSLAELIAADKTITRVGANTVFSFEPAGRAMNLEQGSVLFHSPKGQGGGTIRSKGASAAVLGTTIVVTATTGGGFKAIVLEGKGQITLPNGNFRILTAGQVTFVLPGSRTFGPQLNINLSKLVESSRLVQGFEQELPSKPVIQAAIERQAVLIRTGIAEDTKILVGNQATETTVATVDSTVLEQAVENRVDRLQVAKATDVTVSTLDLRDHPAHLFLDPVPFDIPALGALNFSGFVGKNITLDTHAIDFTPFLGQTEFNIGALEYLTVKGSALALFASPAAGQQTLLREVKLAAKSGFIIPSGAAIAAHQVGDLTLISDAVFSLQNVSFVNPSGRVRLNGNQVLDLTGGGINAPTPTFLLEGATVSLNGGTYNASGSATVSAYGSDLNVVGTTLTGDILRFDANASSTLNAVTATGGTKVEVVAQQDATFAAGTLTASGAAGTASLQAGRNLAANSTTIDAKTIQVTAANNATLNFAQVRSFTTLNVNAVQNIAVSSGSFTGAPMSPANAASFSAGDTLTVNGPTFASVADIALSARTVNLQNIDFQNGSTVRLYSQNGLLAANPNTGAASVPGHVNFIINVNYGGNPAQLFIGGNITIGVRSP